jgi:hypothetical protein
MQELFTKEINVKFSYTDDGDYKYDGLLDSCIEDMVTISSGKNFLIQEGEHNGKTLNFKLVDSSSTYDDGFQNVTQVFEVTFDGVVEFYRTEYYYASYEGVTWEGSWERVYPKEVTVTKYFKKSEL